MRLAKPALARDDERIVLLAGLGDDVARGAQRHFVGRTRHVTIERERGGRRRWGGRAVAHLGGGRLGRLHAVGIAEDFFARGLRIEHRDFRFERLQPLDILHVGRDRFVHRGRRLLLEEFLEPARAVPFAFPP